VNATEGIPLTTTQKMVIMAIATARPDSEIFVHWGSVPHATVLLAYDQPGGTVLLTVTQKDNDWQFAVAPANQALLERVQLELTLLRLGLEG
jgi:hypothetical protein